jgi:hypothetical protein
LVILVRLAINFYLIPKITIINTPDAQSGATQEEIEFSLQGRQAGKASIDCTLLSCLTLHSR